MITIEKTVDSPAHTLTYFDECGHKLTKEVPARKVTLWKKTYRLASSGVQILAQVKCIETGKTIEVFIPSSMSVNQYNKLKNEQN